MTKREQIQQKGLKEALKHKKCTLGMSVGAGKTRVGLLYIKHFFTESLRVLVVIPKLSIITSWEDDAKKFGLEYVFESIEFVTYLSLPKKELDYDILIMDEVHSLTPTNDEWLSGFKGRILGLTGTPPRYDNSEKGKLINKHCPVVYEYITDDAVGDKILNDYRIIVHLLDMDTENNIPVKLKDRNFYTSEQKSYNYWTSRVEDASTPRQKQIASVMRMKTMQGFMSKERYAAQLKKQITDKCIIFCNTKDQADRLSEYSYHSSNSDSAENLQLFKEGSINTLSCVLQLSEGITIPNLKTGIILHGYSGSSPKTQQRFGRLLRLNPNDTCTLHILCYRGTKDEDWINQTLSNLDESKIKYINT